MSDVTRYEMTTDIVPLTDGRWVRYEDYATLAAERDALKEQAHVFFGVNAALQSERDALAHKMRGVRAVEKLVTRSDAYDVVSDDDRWWARMYADGEMLPVCESAASLPALGHALIQGGHVDDTE